MQATSRADVVGSLLRQPELVEIRSSYDAGQATLEQVRAAEDRAVLENIAIQEEAGVDVVSDGEARRTSWIASVPTRGGLEHRAALGGFTRVSEAPPVWFSFWRLGDGQAAELRLSGWSVVTEPLRVEHDIVGEEYGFLARHTSRRTKYCFPAPSYHRAFWQPEHSRDAYPTVDEFLVAVRDHIRREIVDRAIALGCDYLQMDAPNYGQSYTDPQVMDAMRAEGHDLDAELRADVEIDNSVFEGLTGVTRALHVCRGNGPGGSWSAAGGYDLLAPQLFPGLTNYDTLLLEYDTPRAGDFGALRHVASHQTVVLGLLTTKTPELEDARAIEQRLQEAAGYVPLDRLSLSPQCGFASAPGGNPLTPPEQSAKLRRVVEVARTVWGRSE
jgi:5-methyltetrahydropteroyltriglutamate--homocysteine methyltransferase